MCLYDITVVSGFLISSCFMEWNGHMELPSSYPFVQCDSGGTIGWWVCYMHPLYKMPSCYALSLPRCFANVDVVSRILLELSVVANQASSVMISAAAGMGIWTDMSRA
jgi:hypothetical protein